ncbi:phage protein NinX family protein [Xenorhabdus bovienii]|uniref:phage protein NinX family protein n=1 Tax=Xenorhabdus bovienii TaxID=40576 RepID=UPI003DA29153
MKIKANELTGRALDFVVARAIGMDIYMCGRANDDEYGWIGNYNVTAAAFEKPVITVGFCGEVCIEFQAETKPYSPSTTWSQCGELIEKYEMDLTPVMGGTYCAGLSITDGALCTDDYVSIVYGDTPQIAICRAVVAAQLGGEVDIPDELVEGV